MKLLWLLLLLIPPFFTGCATKTLLESTKGKVISLQSSVDGVDIAATNPEDAQATPAMKGGHVMHDYTGVPIKPGQPVRIVKRTYSLFFGVLLNEIIITIWPKDYDGPLYIIDESSDKKR